MEKDLEKLINDVVWWIPFRKLRNNTRVLINKLIENNQCQKNEIDSLKNDINRLRYNLRKVTPKSHIDFIEIHLSEHCNLNCYSCNHFSQLANEAFYDIDIFEKDMNRLYELTNGLINRFSLMGGEPLLNKNCKDYFYITRKYFKNSKIWLVTNGILLLKQDESFWQSCKENNIEIRPTKYPIKIDWEQIKNICSNYNVSLTFFNSEQTIKESIHTVLNLNGTSDPFYNFINCFIANNCVALKNGKLFSCGLPSNIDHFNNYFNKKLEVTKYDYIDIYEAKNYNEILLFLAKPLPFCRYCDINKWYSKNKWLISSKTIDEYM